jgi:hypothetical protein
MSLLNYFKEINIGWKLSLFLVVFCVWPTSSYLIFHFDPLMFTNQDLSKLTLLSSAISSPLLVINTCISFMLTDPKDKDLKLGDKSDHVLSGTVLIGIGISLLVLSFGAIAALMDWSLFAVKLIMISIEVMVLVIVISSKLIEDKRFRRKHLTK